MVRAPSGLRTASLQLESGAPTSQVSARPVVDIYEVFVEVTPLAACSVMSNQDVSGAFVSCYVAATDVEASIAALKIRLLTTNCSFSTF
jgi:hypothetical protein